MSSTKSIAMPLFVCLSWAIDSVSEAMPNVTMQPHTPVARLLTVSQQRHDGFRVLGVGLSGPHLPRASMKGDVSIQNLKTLTLGTALIQ